MILGEGRPAAGVLHDYAYPSIRVFGLENVRSLLNYYISRLHWDYTLEVHVKVWSGSRG